MSKELNLSYKEMKTIPWAMLLRMMADMPRVIYTDDEGEEQEKPKQAKKLTPQTAEDFKAYINQLNQNKTKTNE